MPGSLKNRLVFLLERFIVRGAFFQLLFVAAVIVLVSVAGGMVVFFATDSFQHLPDAVWWAFLRLSDPGYLGDDEGLVARTVSTVVTVLGYVLFMGSLVAIMTQGLGQIMRRLESGVSPITLSGHILILGWTNRTLTIVRELLLSKGRVRRFLRHRHFRSLKIVILAEDVSSRLSHEIKVGLGDLDDKSPVILRSGDPLEYEHLKRVDFLRASAIILPADDFMGGGPLAADGRAIKTMLSISNSATEAGAEQLPVLTCELFDIRKTELARAAYAGDVEIIPSASMISRLIAQNVRHSGLSSIYTELLTHGDGNEIYVRSFPELEGVPFGKLAAMFQHAIPLGIMRPGGRGFEPELAPSPDLPVGRDDRLVFLSTDYDDIAPGPAPETAGPADGPDVRQTADGARVSRRKRVLVCGWSSKVPALLAEFESYSEEEFEITFVSLVAESDRVTLTERYAGTLARVNVTHVEADFTSEEDLIKLRPQEYDNVVFLASERLDSGEEADARTTLGYLLLRSLLERYPTRPQLLIELVDPENESLFANRPAEILISPVIISHLLAQVSLRRDLWAIFDELFSSGGAEIYFRSAAHYGAGRERLRFGRIQQLVGAAGDVALGLFVGKQDSARGRRLHLNPARESEWGLAADDEIVVLTKYS